jgi:hypothetical protein
VSQNETRDVGLSGDKHAILAHTSASSTPSPPDITHARELLRQGDDARRRAMIRNVGLAASRAPVVVVRLEGLVERRIAFVPVAQAPTAGTLAATIVVGHHVVASVGWIMTGADPGDGGLLGAGGTRVLRSATAAAQITVNRTMAPVFAARRILRIIRSVPALPSRHGVAVLLGDGEGFVPRRAMPRCLIAFVSHARSNPSTPRHGLPQRSPSVQFSRLTCRAPCAHSWRGRPRGCPW